jgi:nicotinamide phosphoribosyltransferase
VLRDDVSVTEEAQGLLQTVYEDGKLLRETNLAEIRQRVAAQL